MRYDPIHTGIFRSRPNRFIAHVEIDGKEEVVHVKNTGRCKELLVPGATVYCERSGNPNRKTAYDLVAVEKETPKGKLLINMDSQAPNAAAGEWLESGGLYPDVTTVKAEQTFGSSRFDFYVERPGEQFFLEVKGVTLEKDGVVLFPDAPTERGVKHIRELIRCRRTGYGAYLLFVVQMAEAEYFTPNRETHEEFADVLAEAQRCGVKILAYTCDVTPDGMKIAKPIPVKI